MKAKTHRRLVPLFSTRTVPLLFATATAVADNTPQPLPFGQNWSNPALLNANNDWSGVPGFMGYRGDKLSTVIGTSPQSITAEGTSTPVTLLPNKKNPNSLRTGGVAEFEIENPCVALKGSATASAPFLLLNLNTKGHHKIIVACNLRDLDGSANDAVQPVALQFRVGTNGAFTDLPEAFVADASSGPNLATLVTPVTVTLPAEAGDQSHLQLRWITSNADGNDEWIGIDDIAVIWQDPVGEPQKSDKAKPATDKPVERLRSPRDQPR